MPSHDNKGRSERKPPFIQVTISTWDHPSWRAMSPGARLLCIALRRYLSNNLRNNGKLFLSYRKAMEELNASSDTIRRWYLEAQHYGFIVMTSPGHLGIEGKGKAPHWRLTELPTFDGEGKHVQATRDFDRWDGTRFSDPAKFKTPHQKSVHPALKTGAPPHQKSVHFDGQVHQKSVHTDGHGCTSFRDISSRPYTPRKPRGRA